VTAISQSHDGSPFRAVLIRAGGEGERPNVHCLRGSFSDEADEIDTLCNALGGLECGKRGLRNVGAVLGKFGFQGPDLGPCGIDLAVIPFASDQRREADAEIQPRAL
jgi:hypothetical protein